MANYHYKAPFHSWPIKQNFSVMSQFQAFVMKAKLIRPLFTSELSCPLSLPSFLLPAESDPQAAGIAPWCLCCLLLWKPYHSGSTGEGVSWQDRGTASQQGAT